MAHTLPKEVIDIRRVFGYTLYIERTNICYYGYCPYLEKGKYLATGKNITELLRHARLAIKAKGYQRYA